MMKAVSVWLLPFALIACASSKSASNDPSTIGKGIDLETMRPQEAAQVVREFEQAYGLPPLPPPDTKVTSMAQVLEIIRADRLNEFEAARRYAAGRPGPEAFTLRAYLDLSYAGALLTAAAILDAERQRDMTNLRAFEREMPLQDPDAAKQDQKQAAALRAKVADVRKVVRALHVLSEAPLESGLDLTQQAIKEDPKAQLAYLAAANYYRLRRSWLEYDQMMSYADEGPEDPPVRTFLRAMEALERYADPARCEKLLRETLAKSPNFVRAQANLVLVSDSIENQYRELQELKRLRPNHLVVRLAGPIIEEEYQTAQQLKGTR
jgi:hypothetical protein